MIAMLRRAIQIFLVILGILFVLMAIFTFRTTSAEGAGGFFHSLNDFFTGLLYLFVGFLSFLATNRIGKRRIPKSARPSSPDHKG